MSQSHHDVLIVGGGPCGVALGIELGLQGINTLILEKHTAPLLSPRAQGLNERSMEFFLRWGIAKELRQRQLFPKDYPLQGVWCSKLNGKTYATASSAEQFNPNTTAEASIRIPLYITEATLRRRLQSLPCVALQTQTSVNELRIESDHVSVRAITKNQASPLTYTADYLVGCDGANSITRQQADIAFQGLSPTRRVINLLFESAELNEKIRVEKGFLYYLLENEMVTAMGPVDLQKGIWYAQIVYSGEETDINHIEVSTLLEKLTGISFNKKILNKHFWDMQIQLADHYQSKQRVFLAGDSAHAFAPTGGFGLNTGLGDIVNLGWKLATVIKQPTAQKLLDSYEAERRPIALANLTAAERNAKDAVSVREKFPPAEDPAGFAQENARIAKQHIHASGITLGYCYPPASPQTEKNYTPCCKAGHFLPHAKLSQQAVYSKLSTTRWTLIICGESFEPLIDSRLDILHLPANTYPIAMLLVRPDWHIALSKNRLTADEIRQYLDQVFTHGQLN